MDDQPQEKPERNPMETNPTRPVVQGPEPLSKAPGGKDNSDKFSPLRFLVVLIGGIFLAEVVVMIVLVFFQDLPYYVQTLMDATLMVILIFPLIYYFSLRPLLLHIEERKRTEAALRKSEERFSRAFHSSPAALSITRAADALFIDANDSFLDLFGYSREELIGHNALELGMYVNPDDRAEVRRRSLAHQGLRAYEVAARRKDGEIRAILLSTEGIDLGGEACLLASITDVTERRKAEEALKKERQRFNDILEALPAYIILLTPDYHALFANHVFRDRFGEYTGQRCYEQLFGRSEPCEVCETYMVLDTRSPRTWEWTGPDRHIYRVFDYPFTDTDGSTVILEMGIDITEQKRAETQIAEMALFPALNPGVVLRVDADGRINNLNPTAERLGFRLEGKLTDVIPDLQSLDLASCIASGSTQQVPETRVGDRVLQWTVRGVPGFGHAFLYSTDISLRKRAEQALLYSYELQDRFFNSIDIYIAYMDREFNFIRVNNAYAQGAGHPAEYFPGKNHFALYPNAENQEIFERVVRTGEPYSVYEKAFEYPEYPERGVTYWDWSVQPVMGTNGVVEGIVLSLLDVTERKRAEEKIELERDKLKGILDTMEDGIYIVNGNYEIEYINPVIEAEFGPLDGRKCHEFFHNRPEVCEACMTEQVFQGQVIHSERTSAITGKAYDLLDMPLKNSDGSISKLRYMHDITHLKENERQLQKANLELQLISQEEHKQRQLSDALVGAALVLNKSTNLEDVLNLILEQIRQVIPYQLAEIALLEGDSFYDAYRQGDPDRPEIRAERRNLQSLQHFPLLAMMRQSRLPVLINDTTREPEWIAMEGVAWSRAFLSAPLIVEDQVIGFVNLFAAQPGFFTHDMSDRLVAFAAHAAVAIQNAWLFQQVRASSERLQSLSRRLVEIQESERLYIARELHDEAGQMLTSLMLDLQILENKAAQPDAILKKVAEMEISLNEILENLHRIAMALRPASLDHLGLVPALRQLVESRAGKTGPRLGFKGGKVQKRLPPNVETVVYRVVQEALTNAIRHAHAKRVDVILTVRGDKLIVIVEDDGIGFDPQAALSGNRLGLFGMRERAEMVDGQLLIESAPGSGTTIMMEVVYADSDTDRG